MSPPCPSSHLPMRTSARNSVSFSRPRADLGEKGQHPVIGLVAFQHEIDGEKDDRADVGQLAGPAADGEKQIFREIGRESLQLGVQTGKIEVRNERESMQLIEQLGSARGQLGDQRLHVVQHRGQGEGEKQGGRGRQAQQQEKDGQPAAGMPPARCGFA